MPLDAALTFATVLSIGAALAAYAARVARSGRTHDPRVAKLGGLLGRFPLEALYWVLKALGRRLAGMGLSPDFWTAVSVGITAVSLPLAATGHLAAAGVALLVGAAFDALDGVVAREQGVASPAGAMLDSFVDRYADAAPLMGLAIFYRGSAWQLGLVLAALVGAMLVSYARARAEGLGLDLPSGMMRRHERIAAIAAALLLGPVIPASGLLSGLGEAPVTFGIIALTGVLSNIAAVQLLHEARVRLAPAAKPKPARTTAPAAAPRPSLSEPRPTAAE